MSLQDDYTSDGEWMVEYTGEPVTYYPMDAEPLELVGIIDRNCESPPPYGYENTLSGRCHQVTALTKVFEKTPVRGHFFEFDGKKHKILNVSPVSDIVTFTVEY